MPPLAPTRPSTRTRPPAVIARAFARRGGTVQAVLVGDGFAVVLDGRVLPERYFTTDEVLFALCREAARRGRRGGGRLRGGARRRGAAGGVFPHRRGAFRAGRGGAGAAVGEGAAGGKARPPRQSSERSSVARPASRGTLYSRCAEKV